MNKFLLMLFLATLTGCSFESNRYQVANHGPSQSIVLDTKTGEAWVIKTQKNLYGREQIGLSPIPYYGKQSENNEYAVYKPEETRNESNSSWERILRNKFLNMSKDVNLTDRDD
jgi:formylmethanofuran dehydrogenase subunit E